MRETQLVKTKISFEFEEECEQVHERILREDTKKGNVMIILQTLK